MKVTELLTEKVKATKMKPADAWAHVEKIKSMMAKGTMTQRQLDGAIQQAESIETTYWKGREKAFNDKHAGSDWWELAKKQYPIEEMGNGTYRVKSEARLWKAGKDWDFDHKAQAMEKIEKLVKWLDQNRKRGFGDKDFDIEKFHEKYGHKDGEKKDD